MKKEFFDEIAQITENWNMGFIGKKDYFCQYAETRVRYGGNLWQFLWWKMLCITPRFIFNLV